MTQKDITKYQEIYLKKYGTKIDASEASKELTSLLNLIKSTLSFKRKLDA